MKTFNHLDLRLGTNIQISTGGKWYYITIDILVLGALVEFGESGYSAIPITADVLVDMGFKRVTAEKADNQIFYAHGIHIKKDGEFWVVTLEEEHTFNEVHKLQGFMWELTGKEMRICS